MKKGWEERKLGELFFIKSGGTPLKSKKEYWENGNIPWYSSGELNGLYTKESKNFITNIGLEKSNAKLFPKGSLLIGMYDTAALKMSILDRDATFNQAIAGVKPNKEIDLIFILHHVNAIKPQLLKERRGVRQKNLSLTKIKDITINLPSLKEQKQIVAILDKAFAAIDQAKANVERNLENAKELFQSKLNEVFSQKGDDWEEKTLGKDCIILMGQSPKGTSYNSDSIGTPLINGPVEFGPEPFSKTKKSKWTTEPTKLCEEGDLILCVRGSTTGRINIAGFEACIGRGVAAIRYPKNQVWINFFIRCKQKEIYNLGTGSTFPNVSGKILSTLKFSEPKSIDIQNQLIKTMIKLESNINTILDNYRQKIENLEELKKSILEKAFAGELT